MAFLAPSVDEAVSYQKDFSSKVALIDADRYKHVVTYRMFQELEAGQPYSKELLHDIIQDYLDKDIFDKFLAKAYLFCFSAPSKQVFRNWIAQEKKYKGNRENKPDHYAYDQKYSDMAEVFDYINKRYTVLSFPELEADDLLSMLQDQEKSFIFSHDKDLKQVVGYHYSMDRGVLDYTTESEGMRMLICQALKGDTVDNIPGLHRFGDKALEGFIAECEHVGETQMLMMALKKFTDKLGPLQGMDTFAEMWMLVSMRMNRGAYFKEKYAKAFLFMESLIED